MPTHKSFNVPRLSPINPLNKPFSKKIAGFDIETAGNKNDFVMGSIIGDNIDVSFWNKEELKTFLKSRKMRNYIIVCTNMAFDFLGIFMEEPESFNIIERSGHIYNFKLKLQGKRNYLNFYDTGNYLPVSVFKLGKITGIPKMQQPKCFKRFPNDDEEAFELQEYCRNDALISYKFFKDYIVKYVDDNGLKMKYTIASLSLDDFRRNYLNKTHWVESVSQHKIVQKGYYGGRVESIKRGRFENINCYDFNSLYPSVMKDFEMPIGKPDTYPKGHISLIEDYEGVSYVEGFMPNHYIPTLPMRQDLRLIFPVMNIKGYYTHIELRKAMDKGFQINKIGECIKYNSTEKLFRDYILKKYNTRKKQKENNDPMELMTKLSMNSLYGKFGFRYNEQSSLKHISQCTKKEFKDCNNFEMYGDYVDLITEDSIKRCSYSFPIWSTYIAALGRLKLYDKISNNKFEENLVYYDTDSIFLANNQKICSSNELGELKHEYSSDYGIFVRAKFYCTVYPKIKGIRGIDNNDKFLSVLKTPNIEQEQFIKYRRALKSKEHHKFGKLSINQIIKINKKLNLEDTKRWWTKPFSYTKNEDSSPIFI